MLPSLGVAALPQEQVRLTASQASAQDNWGHRAAVDGNVAVFTTPLYPTGPDQDDPDIRKGAATIHVRSGTSWYEQAFLSPASLDPGDEFGFAAAVSGNTVAIGAPYDDTEGTDTGAVYIYTRSGSTWTLQETLTVSTVASGGAFGSSVALDGDTLVIGAMADDVFQNRDGSAYVFVRSNGVWSQQAKLMGSAPEAHRLLGRSVDISGDHIAVGASGHDHAALHAGAVYVFERSGTTWAQEAFLTASDAQAGDELGYDVAIDGSTVIAGAPYQDTWAGTAYIFREDGSGWSQEAKLKPTDPSDWDLFAFSVDVEGGIALITAHGYDNHATDDPNVGAAYVFTRSGTVWAQESRFTHDDQDRYHTFARNAALSGTRALVTAPGDDASGSDAGAGFIYTLDAVPQPDEEVKRSQDDGGSGGDASDDPTDPTPMASGGMTSGGITVLDFNGTLIPTQDTIDAYGVRIGAGETDVLNFSIQAPNGYDLALRLLDPDGTQVDEGDERGLGGTEHVEHGTSGTPLEEGVWVLVVEVVP
ncbi:MAG: hypothetical protein R3185_04745, partial [Candidatus Thermoplasmatota archaeon]|nr:hypothetical protein [Candidatus Thermoplasmatota archaeon]